jgi:ABC-2 type transport system ATP-binding protein
VAVIHTRNLVKQYGDITALNGVSLKVERGEIFGLLGQNGAGKTTLIKVLLGVISATEGTAEVLDQPAGTTDVRRRSGYLPEDHHFPDYHTGASLLDFYGALLGVSASERRRRIPEALETVGIKGRMHYKIRTYSKGMKQRLGIAQALMHDPELIFFDEPTDGVDPLGRREIRDLMQTLKKQGKTIFLNSHLLGEVELVCDRVAILHRGDVVQEGTIEALTQQSGLFTIGLAPGQDFPVDEVRALGYRVARAGLFWEVALTGEAGPSEAIKRPGDASAHRQNIDAVIQLLYARGLNLRHLVEKRVSLEDLFIETVEAAEPGVDERPRRRRRRRDEDD